MVRKEILGSKKIPIVRKVVVFAKLNVITE